MPARQQKSDADVIAARVTATRALPSVRAGSRSPWLSVAGQLSLTRGDIARLRWLPTREVPRVGEDRHGDELANGLLR